MTQNIQNKRDQDLDVFFDAAKGADLQPSADFMARVMADATDQIALRAKPAVKPAPKAGIFAQLLQSFGGWQVAAPLAACVCLGMFAGYLVPDSLNYIGGTDATATVTETLGAEDIFLAADIEALFQEV
ncbi:MAG: hypothetical protein COB84_02985 [Rhodobacteraceae bacterium]|nr:MAG: hypothetical protein COB84_02985 [Paracoccaceae bacterium]